MKKEQAEAVSQALRSSLESNVGQALTPELATGILTTFNQHLSQMIDAPSSTTPTRKKAVNNGKQHRTVRTADQKA